MVCLILGDETDEHALHMYRYLQANGRDVEMLDSRWFPSEVQFSWELAGSGSVVFPSRRRLRFADVHSVYWRQYSGTAPVALPDEEQSYLADNDSRSLFEAVLMSLQAQWVNGWEGFALHQRKPAALHRVSAMGVPVPLTLWTNDPLSAQDFAARCPHAIFKPVQGGAHARRVTAEHLAPANLDNLEFAPVTFQEEVRGVNVRVFVAGDEVRACEVRTGELDFRDDPRPEIRACELSPGFQGLCRLIARELRLLWTGMDFIRTGDDQYVFLEANPSPMFIGFESQSGLPLTAMLGKLL